MHTDHAYAASGGHPLKEYDIATGTTLHVTVQGQGQRFSSATGFRIPHTHGGDRCKPLHQPAIELALSFGCDTIAVEAMHVFGNVVETIFDGPSNTSEVKRLDHE